MTIRHAHTAVLLLVCAGCGFNTVKLAERACEAEIDCAAGWTCSDGYCHEPDCALTHSCPEPGTVGAFCRVDGECGGGTCTTDGRCGSAGDCQTHDQCDNAVACDGVEQCNEGRCVAGDATDCSHLDEACALGTCTETSGCVTQTLEDGEPCEDGDACTTGDSCASGACAAGSPRDDDEDTVVDIMCGGTDCDDADDLVFPGASERCANGVDDDCDATTPDIFDGDADGAQCDVDCDDSDAAAHPGGTEVCDGADNDCDGNTDDIDEDTDGFFCDVDCDDGDSSVHPDAEEIVCNGADENCNGDADDGPPDSDGMGSRRVRATATTATPSSSPARLRRAMTVSTAPATVRRTRPTMTATALRSVPATATTPTRRYALALPSTARTERTTTATA